MSKQPQNPKPDIATMSKHLRLTTCTMLKLDPNALSPADEILVARVGSLRVLVSDLEAASLRGEQISVGPYCEASEALEKVLRDVHRVEVTADGDPRALLAVSEKMGRLMGLAMSEDEDAGYERDHIIDTLRAEIASLKSRLEARSIGDSEKTTAASSVAPATNAPAAQQTVAPATNNVVPLRTELPISPLVTSGAASFIDDLNRKAW